MLRIRSLVAAGAIAGLAFASPASAHPSGAAAAPLAPVSCTGCWLPALQSRWQYQLQGVAAYASTGGINTVISAPPQGGGAAVSPQVWDFDLYVDQSVSGNNTTLNTDGVNAVHARGGRAICYISAGTWEDWRVDAGQFPASVLGAKNGWPGEKWLDIRQISALGPIMSARIQKCKQTGFDGIEFDNVDGYANRTGFPLTAADQFNYNSYLANVAHQNGLSAALKNDLGQLTDLKPYFDYAINEQCMQYKECDYPPPGLPGWSASGKAVFEVEYKANNLNCTKSNGWNFNAILKDLNLFDTPWTPCR
ncbi:MAG: hypothetical protein QOE17_873 [Gaiellales bacterium]|jgi:hypothetical protein|nr:hypothetical protein [Gaiellales bacterium]